MPVAIAPTWSVAGADGPFAPYGRITHVEHRPARPGTAVGWPAFVSEELLDRLADIGVTAPWSHQAEVAVRAWGGESLVVATGTASGKSLAYLLPVLSAVEARGATALYLCPTKALAADQLAGLRRLGAPGVRATTYDGDTPAEERAWARAHANLLLTNPDMLHRGLLPAHLRWAAWWRRLSFVVVDECHHYRGVFGAHVALVLRRLRRIAAHYGADPVFLLASATVADPARSASRLVGAPISAITEDGAPRSALDFALWEPGAGSGGRRPAATTAAADLLAELVAANLRTLVFVDSRWAAETVAARASANLAERHPGQLRRVAAYRGGYLAEERRSLERGLRSGRLHGLVTTSALELGIDVAGLDAVLLAGYPGSRSTVWQRVGRAGRRGSPALAVLVARDDPLDRYLVRHPAALFARPLEAAAFDPDNPHVAGPHLCAAAQELPVTDRDLPLFGRSTADLLTRLGAAGGLRRRPTGWFWVRRGRAVDSVELRGSAGSPVLVVEVGTGRLLGSVDRSAAERTAHPGAVYLHQGVAYLVDELDVDEGVAFVHPEAADYTTTARETSDIVVVEVSEQRGRLGLLHVGTVDVSRQVVGFVRRRAHSGELIDERRLDRPIHLTRTRAVWWTLPPDRLAAVGLAAGSVAGAVHAAEHAAIALLPLVASCDRWDVGGLSSLHHPDTGGATVFVYDAAVGGAGIAERGFTAAGQWLAAAREAVASCGCESGCPSCVHAPGCASGNAPLDKAAAVRLLTAVLDDLQCGTDQTIAGMSMRVDAGG